MKITFDIFPDVGIASAQSIKYRFVPVITVDEDILTGIVDVTALLKMNYKSLLLQKLRF